MKKIILAIMILSMSVLANEGKLFQNKKEEIGGELGKSVVYLFPNNEASKITDLGKIDLMKKGVVNGICQDTDMKKAISDGYTITFIYPGKETTLMIFIDSCTAVNSNSANIFKNGKGQIGGQVGKSVVYIYPNNEMVKVAKNIEIVNQIEKKLVSSICSDKDMRNIINQNYKVTFIYPGEERTSMYLIDSCK